ncbi:hypothetical protein HanRHA438_Chr09g0382801 [Helianthus annuus]|nr:hypothetical protein HanIR_Chr09g0400431 [Helianthus annuus]KAJ0886728.1 hypothetical protein HanRHA438_Chr09g0382801 [Helianthus annuus]
MLNNLQIPSRNNSKSIFRFIYPKSKLFWLKNNIYVVLMKDFGQITTRKINLKLTFYFFIFFFFHS